MFKNYRKIILKINLTDKKYLKIITFKIYQKNN